MQDIVPAVEQWRYRNKLEYSFGEDPDGRLVCGFHAPGRFDEILPMEDCLLASEPANALRREVLAWCREEGLRAWNRRSGDGLLRNLVVREGRRTGEHQVRLVTSAGDFDPAPLAQRIDAHGLLWTSITRSGETTSGGETEIVDGSPEIAERLCDLDLRISPRGVLPDEHRDGRGAVRRRRRVRRPAGLGAAVRPLLRDRHDRIDARAAGGRAVGARHRPGGDRRRDRQRASQRDRPTRTSSPATPGSRSAS